ncbi:hypothetical protein BDQ17DRAFT_1376329 [Cyathus striatus]|nr:hypothetical protein BDQ17DRAFT_1376329 [Cyathus striatus]
MVVLLQQLLKAYAKYRFCYKPREPAYSRDSPWNRFEPQSPTLSFPPPFTLRIFPSPLPLVPSNSHLTPIISIPHYSYFAKLHSINPNVINNPVWSFS